MKEHLVIPFKSEVGKKIGFGSDIVAELVQDVESTWTAVSSNWMPIQSKVKFL